MNQRQIELMMWHMKEVSDRVTVFQSSPTDDNRRVLIETIEAYQFAAEAKRFIPSVEYKPSGTFYKV